MAKLSIGRQTAKLVGIALSLRYEPATTCEVNLPRAQLEAESIRGAESFQTRSNRRRGRIAGAASALTTKLRGGQSAQPSSLVSSHGEVLGGSCEFRSDSRRQVMTSERIALAGRDLSRPTSRRLCHEDRRVLQRRATLLPTSSDGARLNQPRLQICNPLSRHFDPKRSETQPGG